MSFAVLRCLVALSNCEAVAVSSDLNFYAEHDRVDVRLRTCARDQPLIPSVVVLAKRL